MSTDGLVLLGTVALEPNRWSTRDPSGAAFIALSDWSAEITACGFDGLELWDRHSPPEAPGEGAQFVGLPPIRIFNSYVSFDDPDPQGRRRVTDEARRIGSTGIKINVGNDPKLRADYGTRLATMVDHLPADIALLCECHTGISIAEDPSVAAAIFEAAGPPDRVQAIVHTHESADHIRQRFDAYGERITHIHVNYLDLPSMTAPALADRRSDLTAKVELLADLGFCGSWTIEFVEGLLTDHDEPGALIAQAARDLAVLRDILAGLKR